ncbi:MAG: diguanylate cyclase [Nitrospinaceae bacterium]
MMDKTRFEKLRTQELLVVRSLLKKQNEILGQSLLNLDRLIYMQKSISLMSSREIHKVLTEKLPYTLSIRYFSLFLYDKSKRTLRLAAHNHPDLKEGLTFRRVESVIMDDAISLGKYILEQKFTDSKYFKGNRNPLYQFDFFVSIPLMIENEIIGVLNLNDNDKGFINVIDLDFILNVSEFISLSISNAQSFEKAERLSVTDGLTGLTNRQQMQALLENEVLRCKRYGSSLSLVMIDVDHFKEINDTHGHQEGDEVLVKVASIVKKFCRSHDVAARYGGEEFVLVLPETHLAGARVMAERIRQQVAGQTFEHAGGTFQVTLSCGIAEFDGNLTRDQSDLIRVADQALYRAKEGGRNRTVEGRPDDFPQD